MAAVPVTSEIAQRAAILGFNDLPDDLVERTKQCLLDRKSTRLNSSH